jgi:hypothetical protein
MAQQTAANVVLSWSGAFLGVVSVSAIARSSFMTIRAVLSPGETRPSLWAIARPVLAVALISLVVSGGILVGIGMLFK